MSSSSGRRTTGAQEDALLKNGGRRPVRERKAVNHYSDDNPSTFTVKRRKGQEESQQAVSQAPRSKHVIKQEDQQEEDEEQEEDERKLQPPPPPPRRRRSSSAPSSASTSTTPSRPSPTPLQAGRRASSAQERKAAPQAAPPQPPQSSKPTHRADGDHESSSSRKRKRPGRPPSRPSRPQPPPPSPPSPRNLSSSSPSSSSSSAPTALQRRASSSSSVAAVTANSNHKKSSTTGKGRRNKPVHQRKQQPQKQESKHAGKANKESFATNGNNNQEDDDDDHDHESHEGTIVAHRLSIQPVVPLHVLQAHSHSYTFPISSSFTSSTTTSNTTTTLAQRFPWVYGDTILRHRPVDAVNAASSSSSSSGASLNASLLSSAPSSLMTSAAFVGSAEGSNSSQQGDLIAIPPPFQGRRVYIGSSSSSSSSQNHNNNNGSSSSSTTTSSPSSSLATWQLPPPSVTAFSVRQDDPSFVCVGTCTGGLALYSLQPSSACAASLHVFGSNSASAAASTALRGRSPLATLTTTALTREHKRTVIPSKKVITYPNSVLACAWRKQTAWLWTQHEVEALCVATGQVLLTLPIQQPYHHPTQSSSSSSMPATATTATTTTTSTSFGLGCLIGLDRILDIHPTAQLCLWNTAGTAVPDLAEQEPPQNKDDEQQQTDSKKENADALSSSNNAATADAMDTATKESPHVALKNGVTTETTTTAGEKASSLSDTKPTSTTTTSATTEETKKSGVVVSTESSLASLENGVSNHTAAATAVANQPQQQESKDASETCMQEDPQHDDNDDQNQTDNNENDSEKVDNRRKKDSSPSSSVARLFCISFPRPPPPPPLFTPTKDGKRDRRPVACLSDNDVRPVELQPYSATVVDRTETDSMHPSSSHNNNGNKVPPLRCLSAIWDTYPPPFLPKDSTSRSRGNEAEYTMLAVAQSKAQDTGTIEVVRCTSKGVILRLQSFPTVMGRGSSQTIECFTLHQPQEPYSIRGQGGEAGSLAGRYVLLAGIKGIRMLDATTLECLQVYGESVSLHGRTVIWQSCHMLRRPRYPAAELRSHKKRNWLEREDALAVSKDNFEEDEEDEEDQFWLVGVPHPYRGPSELRSTLYVWDPSRSAPVTTLQVPPGGCLGLTIGYDQHRRDTVGLGGGGGEGWKLFGLTADTGQLWEWSSAMQSDFAGTMYPVGYQIIDENIEYIEDEDELDQVQNDGNVHGDDEDDEDDDEIDGVVRSKHKQRKTIDADYESALRISLLDQGRRKFSKEVSVLLDEGDEDDHLFVVPCRPQKRQREEQAESNRQEATCGDSPNKSAGFDRDVLGAFPQRRGAVAAMYDLEQKREHASQPDLRELQAKAASAAALKVKGKRTKTATVEAMLQASVDTELRRKMGTRQASWATGSGSLMRRERSDAHQHENEGGAQSNSKGFMTAVSPEEKELALELLFLSPGIDPPNAAFSTSERPGLTKGVVDQVKKVADEMAKDAVEKTLPSVGAAMTTETKPGQENTNSFTNVNSTGHAKDSKRSGTVCPACEGRMVMHRCGQRELPVDYEALERAEKEKKAQEEAEKQRQKVEKRRAAEAKRREARKKKKEEDDRKRREEQERLRQLEAERFAQAGISEQEDEPIETAETMPNSRHAWDSGVQEQPLYLAAGGENHHQPGLSAASTHDLLPAKAEPIQEPIAAGVEDAASRFAHAFLPSESVEFQPPLPVPPALPDMDRHPDPAVLFDSQSSHSSHRWNAAGLHSFGDNSVPSEESFKLGGTEVKPSTSLSASDALAALAGLAVDGLPMGKSHAMEEDPGESTTGTGFSTDWYNRSENGSSAYHYSGSSDRRAAIAQAIAGEMSYNDPEGVPYTGMSDSNEIAYSQDYMESTTRIHEPPTVNSLAAGPPFDTTEFITTTTTTVGTAETGTGTQFWGEGDAQSTAAGQQSVFPPHAHTFHP